MQLRAQHEREEADLQDKVSVRRALLEEKVPYIVCGNSCYSSTCLYHVISRLSIYFYIMVRPNS